MTLVMVAVIAGPGHGGCDITFLMMVVVTVAVSLVEEDFWNE